MLFASVMSDVLMWTAVVGYLANVALNRMFGAEWPKQLGDYLRIWWGSRIQQVRKDETES